MIPDGIIIADTLIDDAYKEGIHLYVENSLQFEEDKPYRLSLNIGSYPGNGEKRYQLLGYSRLQQYN